MIECAWPGDNVLGPCDDVHVPPVGGSRPPPGLGGPRLACPSVGEAGALGSSGPCVAGDPVVWVTAEDRGDLTAGVEVPQHLREEGARSAVVAQHMASQPQCGSRPSQWPVPEVLLCGQLDHALLHPSHREHAQVIILGPRTASLQHQTRHLRTSTGLGRAPTPDRRLPGSHQAPGPWIAPKLKELTEWKE